MSSISNKEVLHVARLARLEMESQEVAQVAEQLGAILDYMEMLNRVDTQGVEPTTHAVPRSMAFREDRVHAHLKPEEALANAPAREAGSFRVPKVIG